MYFFIKRFLDFFSALVLLSLLSPIFLATLTLLAIALRGNPFFTQQRPGYKGKAFYIVKFRTMTNELDHLGNLLPDADRLTRVGKFVRSTSLDELPQFINVLKGDMSFIGPRPLLMEYLPLYSDFEMKRHQVKPGISGWAQVNGRNAITWKKKFALDVEYVENFSLAWDIKIAILTVKKVFKRDGINSAESVTAEKYNGCN